MGIRINAYAVDVPRFEEFLAQPVGRVLQYVVDHGTDREYAVHWWEPERGPVCAMPGKSVYRIRIGGEGGTEVLPDPSNSTEPFLARVAADYLREASSYQLNFLLRALVTCPNCGFVKEITAGDRRWWIGSLLDFTEQSRLMSASNEARFVLLWQKLLRVFDCDKVLPPADVDPACFDFPIIPLDDCDLYMSAWTEDEARFLVDCLRRIQALQPRFKVAPLTMFTEPDEDEEWNEWVHRMIREFLSIGDIIDFDRLAVVGFIG